MKMSQKILPKTTKVSQTKPATKIVSKNITQTKTVKKSDELNDKKMNKIETKTVKNPIKPNNTLADRKKTSLISTDVKKKTDTVSKATVGTKPVVTKPLNRNLNTKTPNQLNNNKFNDLSNKTVIKKNTDVIKKDVPKKIETTVPKRQSVGKKPDKIINGKVETQHQKDRIAMKNETTEQLEKNSRKQLELDEQANKESSDEQYVSLATLESYSAIENKHARKTSESVLAEPPSICDTEMDEMVNNISDYQINDDFPSEYCDDFEDYESDFEDDDDEEDDEQDYNEEDEDEVRIDNGKDQKQQLIEKTESLPNNRLSKENKGIVSKENISKEIKDSNLSPDVNKSTAKTVDSTHQTLTDSMSWAKIQSETDVQRIKTNKRSKELLEIIKLDEICFTNFDLPPINYDVFIKIFGRKDTKQVSCQTSEREDSETQTDSVQSADKWTQNPSFTRLVSGNDNQLNENNCFNNFEAKVNPFELILFLNKAETLISAIIEIESDNQYLKNKRSLPKGAEQFSTNYSVIKCLSLAKKCPISLCFVNSIYLFCVQNVSKLNGSAEKSVITVWSLMSNRTEPSKLLICRSHIVNGFSDENLVISAMIDGSVALWDLNQESLYEKELDIDNNKFLLKTPSYNCALTSKGHDYPIVGLCKLFDSSSGNRFIQFGTIDEKANLIVWAVTEAKEETNDSPVFQTSEYRITKISLTNYFDKFDLDKSSSMITAFQCQPNEWSNFYCGTDNGSIIRCTRIEESIVNSLPKIYQKSHLNSIWTKVSVICFNESEINKFLVAFTDGIVSYYSISNENPLIVFTSNELPIIDLKWIPDTIQTSFIALNNSNQILIWDLNCEQSFNPIIDYRHSNDNILSMSLWKGLKTILIFGSSTGQSLVFDFCIEK